MSTEQISPSTAPGEPDGDDAIARLAELTAQRDRELLDVSLAQGVLELLGVAHVGVYRLVGRDDEVQRWFCSGLARRGTLTVSDPPWVNLESLPLLSAHPLRQSVLGSRLLEQGEMRPDEAGDGGPRFVSVFPLHSEVGMPGVLEVWSEQALSLPSLKPIQTLLKVFGNFQNLLESSQRDTLTGLLNRQTFDAAFMKASMPALPPQPAL